MTGYHIAGCIAIGAAAVLSLVFDNLPWDNGSSTNVAVPAMAATAVAPQSKIITVDNAQSGETVILGKRTYGIITISDKHYSPAITLDASDAKIGAIKIMNSSGITVRGGAISGAPKERYAVLIRESRDIEIDDMDISGAIRGIVVDRSKYVSISRNKLHGLRSDGINLALSQHIAVTENSCENFTPAPPVYDAQRKLIKDGDHPDCIQAWSRPTHPPTSDIKIIANRGSGKMQGIFLGNHVRKGVDDGGFDNIEIRDNKMEVAFYWGVSLQDARNSLVTNNSVKTVPGSFNPRKPEYPIRAKILVTGTNNIVCGNRIADFPNSEAAKKCPRKN